MGQNEGKKSISNWFKALPALGQGADITSTLLAKNKGLKESNPLMANNKVMIPSKIGLAIIGTLLTKKYEKTNPKVAKAISIITGASGMTNSFINTHRMVNSKK